MFIYEKTCDGICVSSTQSSDFINELVDIPTRFARQPRLGSRLHSTASGLRLKASSLTMSVTSQLRTSESIDISFRQLMCVSFVRKWKDI